MELQEIEVFIEKNGKVQIQVRGVQGGACLDLTRDLEAALGGQIESREMTPEAYATDSESEQDWEQARTE